jgi:FkbM family methyltransferase
MSVLTEKPEVSIPAASSTQSAGSAAHPGLIAEVRRRGRIAWRMARLYRNWPMAVLDRFYLVKPQPIVYRLRNGLQFSVGTRDAGIINEIWLDGAYTSAPGFAIRDHWVVADLGGHKGIFAVFSATRAKGVKVFSFEPSPENFALLTSNLQRNKLTNVKAFNVAVSNRDGESTLHITPEAWSNTLLEGPESESRSAGDVRVETWSLSRVLRTIGSPVDLVKMDIEGMEYQSLLSCPPEDLRSVARIAMEYHHDPSPHPHTISELVQFLNANGFTTQLYPGQELLIAEQKSKVF